MPFALQDSAYESVRTSSMVASRMLASSMVRFSRSCWVKHCQDCIFRAEAMRSLAAFWSAFTIFLWLRPEIRAVGVIVRRTRRSLPRLAMSSVKLFPSAQPLESRACFCLRSAPVWSHAACSPRFSAAALVTGSERLLPDSCSRDENRIRQMRPGGIQVLARVLHLCRKMGGRGGQRGGRERRQKQVRDEILAVGRMGKAGQEQSGRGTAVRRTIALTARDRCQGES